MRLASTSSRRWNITSARRPRPVARQPGNAALAAATAASTSATLAKSTLAACSPVAGLNTVPDRPDVPSTTAPSIQCEMRFIVVSSSDEILREAALEVAAVALARRVNVSSSTMTVPRLSTVSTLPSISKPSHAEWSMFMWCLLRRSRSMCRPAGSQTRMSASAPGAMTPFCGYRPNIRAGVVQHVSTQRSSVISPLTTPWYSSSMRCSTPPMPLGILEKSPRPSSFCSFMQNGQWSVDTTASSFIRRPFHRSAGGARAWSAAASSRPTWRPRSRAGRGGPRSTGRGTAGTSRRTRSGRAWRAAATSSSASDADMWTMYSGTLPATLASWIARCVASPSSSAGRVKEWYFGSVSPRARAWATSTSMAMPFSACIMIIAPDSPAFCIARRIWPSSV